MFNPPKAALALVDQFVQDPHARIQIRMLDPVGVKQVELIGLRHLPGGLLQLVEELQIRRGEFLLLAAGVVLGVAELVPSGLTLPSMAKKSRPAGSLNELAFDMGILLDALGAPGCLDRGRNLEFLGIHVSADVRNRELP